MSVVGRQWGQWGALGIAALLADPIPNEAKGSGRELLIREVCPHCHCRLGDPCPAARPGHRFCGRCVPQEPELKATTGWKISATVAVPMLLPASGLITERVVSMTAVYPLDRQREIHRRWFHRFVPTDSFASEDRRPKHPNDIRPLPKALDN